jgi:hypothetical protein
MPTLEQLEAAEQKMHEAQHRVFDYVQRPESRSVDPVKYHDLSEAQEKQQINTYGLSTAHIQNSNIQSRRKPMGRCLISIAGPAQQ